MTGFDRDEAKFDLALDATSADFDDEGVPRSGDEALIRNAIDGAMARAAVSPRTAVARRGYWRRGIPIAAAALIVTSSAMALIGRVRATRSQRAETANRPVQVAPPIAAPQAAPPADFRAEPPPSTSHEPSPAPTSAPSTELDAAELFSQANESRRHGDVSTALRRYTLLQHRFPHSPEAALSQVAVGRLYLDRLHDPGRALAQFDAYLAEGNDTLREEALVGRALALQRLGRASDERDAWRTLLQAYPSSLSSDRAKERLDELH